MNLRPEEAAAPANDGGGTSISAKPPVRSQTKEQLGTFLAESGQPSYRLDQLLKWVHQERADDWEVMTTLPKTLRQQLSNTYSLVPLGLVRRQGSSDTTQKFLWRLSDGALIESVLIPANPSLYGEASDRHTLCVSTQVGCAYGCRFCASGLDGWKRNLAADEIISQVYAVENDRVASERAACSKAATDKQVPPSDGRLVNNLVIMGMGEPLANYASLLQALRVLNAPWGGGIGARKITVSTSGLVPQIRQLASEPEQFRLAISLHGATDEVRNKIMPVNRKYPLRELADACAFYRDRKGRMITLEYILLQGVNDGEDQIEPLSRLASRLGAKVNLIPYNAVEGLPWARPDEATQEGFLAGLEKLGTHATLRREKGHDIDAACGQLRLKTEKELAA